MGNFAFLLKTKLYFGENEETRVGEIISSYGFKNVLVLIGGGSIKRDGILDSIINSLNKENLNILFYEGIRVNPEFKFVRERIEEIKNFKPDIVLAVGGGSVIDTAKSIAASYFYDGDGFDFNLHKAQPKKSLPIGCILTISAAGSEMSTSCVMQDDDLHIKLGFNTELNRPLFAIESPRLTFTVSKTQTAYGIVDILMHTIERYFSESSDFELCDDLALGLIKSVIKSGEVAHREPDNYDARANLMLASSVSHSGFTSIGKTYKMPVHALEHGVSGLYPHVAHAAGLAVLFPKWARYYIQYDVDKFDKFAKEVFNLSINDKMENGLEGIKKIEEYFKSLNMPTNFNDLDIENPDIKTLVNIITNNGTRVVGHHVKPMDENVVSLILENCI